ncbi:MAG: sensor histidine kinase [Kiritimatiellae bacterium]|nr:sensor histidine kinase [Kiritimatiellia bacterium]
MKANATVLLVLLLSPALLAAAPSGVAEITTAAELKALTAKGITNTTPFRLEGTVTAVFPSSFVVEDDTGWALLQNERRISVAGGDAAVVYGYAYPNLDITPRHLYLHYAKRIDVTGRREAPRPVDAALSEIASGAFDGRLVRVRGLVVSDTVDEIDRNFRILLVSADKKTIAVFISSPIKQDGLVNGEIEITGLCLPRSGHWRQFQGHIIKPLENGISVLRPPPSDPFDAPPMDIAQYNDPEDMVGMGMRRVDGTVLAAWNGDRFLMRTGDGQTALALLAPGQAPPSCGETVRVAGFPDTDLFNLQLANARWRGESAAPAKAEAPRDLEIRKIVLGPTERHGLNAPLHGCLVRFRGIVRNVPPLELGQTRMYLERDQYVVPVDLSGVRSCIADVSIGCELEITGLCVLEAEEWRPNAPLPKVRELYIVPRTAADVKVVARPPWWTPGRLMVALGVLAAALLGVFAWNRALSHAVAVRGRRLFREELAHAKAELKIEERTRLAVELHDSLSQTLTGVAFQIEAAERARQKDPNRLDRHLSAAQKTLASCRRELTNCLSDLRSRTFEEQDAEKAMRLMLEPHAGETEVSVDFKVPRAHLSDATFHAILQMTRELVVNAIRHGKARHVAVSGGIDRHCIFLSVQDDGVGFDPENRPGVSEGHFGLKGVSERLDRLGGRMEIESSPGQGAKVDITLPLSTTPNPPTPKPRTR